VVEMNVEGEIRETHELGRLDLQDVAVTPDEERMLGVANLLSTKGGLQPTLSRAEKRIVGPFILCCLLLQTMLRLTIFSDSLQLEGKED